MIPTADGGVGSHCGQLHSGHPSSTGRKRRQRDVSRETSTWLNATIRTVDQGWFHVKHLDQTHEALLQRLLEEACLDIDLPARRLLTRYLDGIIEKNRSLNLTRIADPVAGVRLHLVDSLLALPEVLAAPAGPLLDIGTGGGFPGVPLCIASARAGVLLDSVGKKAGAVNEVLRELELDRGISAVHERAEDHARHARGEYAVVTARAVSELPVLVELAAPLLVTGGRMIALKGSPSDDELERGRLVGALVGMKELTTRSVVLPGGDERRCLVVYERRASARVRTPRKPGEAQRAPLG